jgi:hypothetical protein
MNYLPVILLFPRHSHHDVLGMELTSPRLAIAIHEAGHAIVARALGVPAGRASIEPDGDNSGFAETADPETCRDVWASQGKSRPDHFATDACAIVSMAGVIAERLVLGEDCGGHASDLADIESFIPDDPGDCRKERLAQATWQLVERTGLALSDSPRRCARAGCLKVGN